MAKTIMIVDDEADNRTTVKAVLEKEGYKVITANNADDALKKAEKEKPDLILMDIMMPGTPVKDIIPKKNKSCLSLCRENKRSRKGRPDEKQKT